MWAPKQTKSGVWVCENKHLDTTDETFASESEAKAWADKTNAVFAAKQAAWKEQAAKNAAERAATKAMMPTEILTSRGDGWEGNGR